MTSASEGSQFRSPGEAKAEAKHFLWRRHARDEQPKPERQACEECGPRARRFLVGGNLLHNRGGDVILCNYGDAEHDQARSYGARWVCGRVAWLACRIATYTEWRRGPVCQIEGQRCGREEGRNGDEGAR